MPDERAEERKEEEQGHHPDFEIPRRPLQRMQLEEEAPTRPLPVVPWVRLIIYGVATMFVALSILGGTRLGEGGQFYILLSLIGLASGFFLGRLGDTHTSEPVFCMSVILLQIPFVIALVGAAVFVPMNELPQMWRRLLVALLVIVFSVLIACWRGKKYATLTELPRRIVLGLLFMFGLATDAIVFFMSVTW